MICVGSWGSGADQGGRSVVEWGCGRDGGVQGSHLALHLVVNTLGTTQKYIDLIVYLSLLPVSIDRTRILKFKFK